MSVATNREGVRSFRAIVFDGERTARLALKTLRDDNYERPWIDEVALVSRNRRGGIHAQTGCEPSVDDVPSGARAGPPTGAMLSLVYGMGALMSASANPKSAKSGSFGAALTNDTSALLLIADEATLFDFAVALASFDEKIIGRWEA